jgi:hypothetical protein
MIYIGDFLVGATVRGTFNTRTASGAPVTLTSGTLRVYKDDGTTESSAGITLTTDFDSRTGLHQFEIDTSADGTFYSAGSDFYIVLTVGTVDGVSVVGVCVAHFSIRNRSLEDFSDTAADVAAEVDNLLTAVIPDSIPADGTRPSMKQALYMIVQFLMERSVSSTTMTVKKVDGSSALLTLTLNDATSPTSITRAT